MVLYLLINRCDIMNSWLFLLVLGCLCFCVAVNPTESSDWDERFSEISEKYGGLENCTQCDNKQSCSCYEYVDKVCKVCCPNVSCCLCINYSLCCYEQQQLIIMTQIGISILFGFGIIGLIIVYCKICNRTRQHIRTRRRCIVLHEERDLTSCSTIEDLSRDRPPSYNEILRNAPPVYTSSCNNAPPLYTSPYNRTSMQEAPPSYPGTPKPQEKSQDSNGPSFSPTVVQHI